MFLNKSELKESSYPYLKELAKFLNENGYNLEIAGHTDNTGTNEINQTLSDERAKVVMFYLVSKGVSENKISCKGYGYSKPIASNESEAGRTLNRRVEIKIVK